MPIKNICSLVSPTGGSVQEEEEKKYRVNLQTEILFVQHGPTFTSLSVYVSGLTQPLTMDVLFHLKRDTF